MNEATVLVIERIKALKLFTHLGVVDASTPIILSSWKEVQKTCGADLAYSDLYNFAIERLIRRVTNKNKNLDQWTKDVKLFKTLIREIIGAKKAEQPYESHIYFSFISVDFTQLCLETEYSMPGFFTDQALWYFKGHYPCGWKWTKDPGENWQWPDLYKMGQPIIY